MEGFDLHFRPGIGENYCAAPSSRRRQRSSALHLDRSNPLFPLRQKGPPRWGGPFCERTTKRCVNVGKNDQKYTNSNARQIGIYLIQLRFNIIF